MSGIKVKKTSSAETKAYVSNGGDGLVLPLDAVTHGFVAVHILTHPRHGMSVSLLRNYSPDRNSNVLLQAGDSVEITI